MYITMNRFEVDSARADEFEEVWKSRDSYLHEMDGFISFRFLRGEDKDGKTLFISSVNWRGKSCFDAWVSSEQFKKAHGQKRLPEGILKGHPKFEAYTVASEIMLD